MELVPLTASNAELMLKTYCLAVRPRGKKGQPNKVSTLKIPNSYYKGIEKPSYTKNIPQLPIQVLSIETQLKVHDKLKRIFERNKKSYENPRLIARLITFGLTPKGKIDMKAFIESKDKRKTDSKDTGLGRPKKQKLFGADRQDFKIKKHDVEQSMDSDFDINSVHGADGIKDLIELDDLRGPLGITVVYMINHLFYRSKIPAYMAPLMPHLFIRKINVNENMIPPLDERYLQKIYLPVYTASNILSCSIESSVESCIIAIDKQLSLADKQYFDKHFTNYRMIEPGCALLMYRNFTNNEICWIMSDLMLIEAHKMIGKTAKESFNVLYAHAYETTVDRRIVGGTKVFIEPTKNYVLDRVFPSGNPNVNPIILLRTREFFERVRLREEGKFTGMNIYGIIANKGTGKSTLSRMLVERLASKGIGLSVIDSDEYGYWLTTLLENSLINEDFSITESLDDYYPGRPKFALAERSFFNIIMCMLLKKHSITSRDKLTLLYYTTRCEELFNDYKEYLQKVYSTESYSMQAYYDHRLPQCPHKNVIVECHTTLDNVRSTPSDLFVRLGAFFDPVVTITLVRPSAKETAKTGLFHLGELALHYYYETATVPDVALVYPANVLYALDLELGRTPDIVQVSSE
ncbi:VP5 [Erinnyis ello cypovirus 2]|nr:VP5 [Erinnyis ello cypovirus 2]